MAEPCIPIIDLSPFIKEDKDGKTKAMETITKACSEYGFFQIVNHGVPLDLVKGAMKQSKTFFDYPVEEKNKSSPSSNALFPAGYTPPPLHTPDKHEFLLAFPPGSNFNVYPENPPQFREAIEELFKAMSKLGVLLESILSECLCLPPNFLKEFNHDRSWDIMAVLRYFEASNNENIGAEAHEDGSCVTVVVQDGVGGLQVLHNGDWIPIVPKEGTIVVNVGDVIQVLSNKKFKSPTHRVVRARGQNRYSFAFFHNLTGDKWVEPLPQFTKEIGEPPKYRGFLYDEYLSLRIRNKTHPPSRPEDLIKITHFEIDT